MENIDEIIFDPNEIQICEPFNEMKNRIDCFLKRKLEENNEENIRMYCSQIYNSNFADSSRTCCTVAAKRQKGSECFVKTTKVHNPSGPLLNCDRDPTIEKNFDFSSASSCSVEQKSDVHERISNLEKCLNIKSNESNVDIYEKLKSIENHVLQLENMLLKNNKNSSLSNIFLNIQPMEVVNHDLTTNYISTKEELDTKENLITESTKSVISEEVPTKSKYTANEIQSIINDIKKHDRKQIHFEL